MPKVFISHAAADKKTASYVAEQIETHGKDTEAFVSSRPGDIPPTSEWLASVQQALSQADKYLVLLTPNSIQRPWVWFEAGAAWHSKKPLVLARAGGIEASEVPEPLGTKQLPSLEVADEVRAVLSVLGVETGIAEEMAARISELSSRAELAGAEEPVWESLELDGVHYAWAGPLVGLEDRDGIVAPTGLEDAFRRRGLNPYWARPDKLRHHFGKGRAQVFVTDLLAWKRPLLQGDLILLVGGLNGQD